MESRKKLFTSIASYSPLTKVMLFAACLLAAANFSGCSTRHAIQRKSVGTEMIIPEGADRAIVEQKQRFFMPSPINSALPEFPESPNGTASNLVICAEVVINTEGSVDSVTQITPEPSCGPPSSVVSNPFFAEVRSTVSRWSFIAAGVCTFVNDEAKCDGRDAVIAPVAVKLAYRFIFTTESGKQVVESSRLK